MSDTHVHNLSSPTYKGTLKKALQLLAYANHIQNLTVRRGAELAQFDRRFQPSVQ